MSDIVERLLQEMSGGSPCCALTTEAANEIERLRAALKDIADAKPGTERAQAASAIARRVLEARKE